MRRTFHPLLLAAMRADPRIHLLTADLGYGMWDAIRAEFPDRYLNVMADEQLLLGTACAWATEGRIPVAYSITPFLLKRPFEWIDHYLNHEGIPVKLLGGGRLREYREDGHTHDCSDDRAIMALWPRITPFWPADEAALPAAVAAWLATPGPSYLNLSR